MLANIVALAVDLVDVTSAGESSIGHVLLVVGPRDVLRLEQVDNGKDFLRRIVDFVVFHTEVVSSDTGEVVRLRGVGGGVVVGQSNTTLGEVVEIF